MGVSSGGGVVRSSKNLPRSLLVMRMLGIRVICRTVCVDASDVVLVGTIVTGSVCVDASHFWAGVTMDNCMKLGKILMFGSVLEFAIMRK